MFPGVITNPFILSCLLGGLPDAEGSGAAVCGG